MYDTDLCSIEDVMKQVSPFKFVGVMAKLPESGCVGDIVAIDNTEYMYSGSEWIEIGSPSSASDNAVKESNKKQLIKMECSSCGGQLIHKGGEDYVCPHCGFKYKWN